MIRLAGAVRPSRIVSVLRLEGPSLTAEAGVGLQSTTGPADGSSVAVEARSAVLFVGSPLLPG
jgi:hypothetical protein